MLEVNFSPFPEIHTERLLLRKIVESDAQEVLNLRSDEAVMRYIDRKPAANLADAEAFIKIIIDSLNSNTGITWAVTLNENPERLIGSIGYWRIMKENYRAEIGYMLSPAYWQKGIMKEALLEVIKFGFESLNLHSIEANINPDNIASENILISTGFTRDAYFKENFFFDGVFKDTAIYSRLKQ